MAGLVLPRIVFEATKPGGGTAWVDMLIGLGLAAVIAPIALAAGAADAARAVEEIRAARPGAVVVRCLASQLYTGLFLKPGQSMARTRDGDYVLLVADDEGIEVFGIRKKTWFGLVPWDRVGSISLGSVRAPLRSRPTIIVDIDARYTPYIDQFELLLEGPDRGRPAEVLAAITRRSGRHRPEPAEGTLTPAYGQLAPISAARDYPTPGAAHQQKRQRWTLAGLVSIALLAVVAAVAVASIPRPSPAAAAAAQQPTSDANPYLLPTDPREAQLRHAVESAGWLKYSEDLYFRWEPTGTAACKPGWTGGCLTVQIESVSAIRCDAGLVSVSFLQGEAAVSNSSGNFHGLEQGVPLEVGIPFDTSLNDDGVGLDGIFCGH
ncbi:hypothetical protein [Sinomonas soli]